jgi:cell division protein FtsB
MTLLRPLVTGLSILLVLLQYRLWFADTGVPRLWEMEHAIVQQIELNQQLDACNRALRAEVIDLKSGREALEERARSDLGMIKPGELFVSLVDDTATPRISAGQRGPCEEVIQ